MISKLKANCHLTERVGPIRNNFEKEQHPRRSLPRKKFCRESCKQISQRRNTDRHSSQNQKSVSKTHTKKIIDRAKEISKAFFHLNTLYSSVHSLAGHDSPVSKGDIARAEKAVKKYMSYFRRTFPQESVTPKQHVSEQHVCKWMESCGFGMALHGEQGVEQTHAVVNALKPRVRSIMNKGTRVDSLIKEHYITW